MVTQYILDAFDTMCAVANGAYVAVYDYTDLEKRHDTFLKDVRAALDAWIIDRSSSADGDMVKDLEAAFIAEDNPQRE
jgi:hypothetical protein